MTWNEFSLSECCLDFKYGKMPPREFLSETGYPIFTGYRVSGFSREYLYEEPQLIIVARGVGGTGDVKLSPPKAWITNLSIVLKLDETRVHKQFMLYKLRLEGLKEKLNTGAAQAQITIENLRSYRIKVPSLKNQRYIASILVAYDDCIASNQRRIILLERAAMLTFREWFVHMRFPEHQSTQFVEGTPKGWLKRPLSDIAEFTMGQSPKSEFYNSSGEGLPFHQGVSNYGFRFVVDEIFTTKPTKITQAGDILFSVRAPVGRINYTLNEIVLGRGLASVRSLSGHRSFLFYSLKNHFFKEDMIGGGAIFAATNRRELEAQHVLVPDSNTLGSFEAFAEKIDSQIQAITLMNRNLTRARDLLLPRLMDGRIPV